MQQHLKEKFHLIFGLQHSKIDGSFNVEQRYKIETYKNTRKNISEISEYIGKDKSVISREIKRNSDQRSGIYKASLAEKNAGTVTRLNIKNVNSMPM